MQNLGLAFSLLPLARRMQGDRERIAAFLTRHLQLFNTHPYLSGPIIGSVARMEEQNLEGGDDGRSISNYKNALTGPYAALGDAFFWGALKPCAATYAVLVALVHVIVAPFACLVLFNPAHLWVRIKGFTEGYTHGREGIEFVRRLDLQRLAARVRWLSLAGLGACAAVSCRNVSFSSGQPFILLTKGVYLALLLLCYWGIRNGISQVTMLYSMFLIGCVISL